MVRLVHQRFATRPVTVVTVVALAFGAIMLVAQAGPAAAQATATRPVGTAIATTAATIGQGAGTAVATRAATTVATATRVGTSAATAARPAATGTGGGAAATAPRPAATAPRPAATAPRPAATAPRPAATATRPAAAGTAPAAMPRTGGGGMATSFVDESTAPNRGLAFGLAGFVGILGAGAVYARRLRRS